jgi:hypothetical protein
MVIARAMKLMMPEDERLRRYLLGHLRELERDALDELLIADDELRTAVDAAERDLIDEYVRGGLHGDEKSSFEQLFFASARRRQKVTVARALANATAASRPLHRNAEPQIERRSWLSWIFPSTRPAVGFALAALALLMFAGAVWFVYRQRPPAERAGIENSAPPAAVPISPTPQEASPPDKGPDTEIVTGPNNSNSGAASEQRLQQTPSVASFLILPGSVRSSDDGQLLTIPARAQSVKLRLSLEGQPATGAVRAELRRQSADGELVWRTGSVRAQRSSLGPFVLMELPAAKLPAGKYAALIKGAGDDGRVETLYAFSVTRK